MVLSLKLQVECSKMIYDVTQKCQLTENVCSGALFCLLLCLPKTQRSPRAGTWKPPEIYPFRSCAIVPWPHVPGHGFHLVAILIHYHSMRAPLWTGISHDQLSLYSTLFFPFSGPWECETWGRPYLLYIEFTETVDFWLKVCWQFDTSDKRGGFVAVTLRRPTCKSFIFLSFAITRAWSAESPQGQQHLL